MQGEKTREPQHPEVEAPAGGRPDPSRRAATAQSTRAVRQAAKAAQSEQMRRDWEAFREDIEFMASMGETLDGAARRRGVTRHALLQQFYRRGVPLPDFPGDYTLKGPPDVAARRLARTN